MNESKRLWAALLLIAGAFAGVPYALAQWNISTLALPYSYIGPIFKSFALVSGLFVLLSAFGGVLAALGKRSLALGLSIGAVVANLLSVPLYLAYLNVELLQGNAASFYFLEPLKEQLLGQWFDPNSDDVNARVFWPSYPAFHLVGLALVVVALIMLVGARSAAAQGSPAAKGAAGGSVEAVPPSGSTPPGAAAEGGDWV